MILRHNKKVLDFEESDKSLVVSSDLHGNYNDFEKIVEIAAGMPVLFLGDVIHTWLPDETYEDESIRILDEIIKSRNLFQIIGNHEFMQLNGDITNAQNSELTTAYVEPFKKMAGDKLADYLAYFRELPLLARTPCGVLLSHTGPTGAMDSLNQLNDLDYERCPDVDYSGEGKTDLLGNLLFRKNIKSSSIDRYLEVTCGNGFESRIAVYGHIPQDRGFDFYGSNQFILCTSFGADKKNKTYLFFDFKKRFASITDFKGNKEICLLYKGE